MKQWNKKKLVLALICSILMIVFILVEREATSESNAAVLGAGNIIDCPVYDPSYPVGTDENPFVVLEIVPYEGFATFGYLVAGQEPVNLKIASYSDYAANNIRGNSGMKVEQIGRFQTFDPNDDIVKASTDPSSGINKTPTKQYGYYREVGANNGDYIQKIMEETDGLIEDAVYEYKGEGLGNYQWVGYEPTVTHDPVPTDHNSTEVHTYQMRDLYTGNEYKITNNNVFLNICLEVTDTAEIENYKIKVITVTPNQLNVEGNLRLIDRANLISITDKTPNIAYVKLWENDLYRNDGMFEVYENLQYTNYDGVRFFSPGRDLSWEAVDRIFRKQANYQLLDGVEGCPIIYDANSLTSALTGGKEVTVRKKAKDDSTIEKTTTGYINNVYKLGLMLVQMKSARFCELYFDNNTIISTKPDGHDITTGTFSTLSGDASIYWNVFTLYPYELLENLTTDIKDQFAAIDIRYEDFTNDGYAMDNTYMYTGDLSMTMSFTDKTVSYRTYTKDAFLYYGITDPTQKLSPAEVINFLLIRSKDGKNLKDIKILEIQPGTIYTKTETYRLFHTDEYWKGYINEILPAFDGPVSVDRMTTKEFNCSTKNLQGTYDLIYLGMNAYGIDKTDLTDTSLRELIYMHVGDQQEMRNKLGHMNDWFTPDVRNFSSREAGNDITELKEKELLSYTRAGYPIIYESNMVSSGTVNDRLIDQSSNMYVLIKSFIDITNTTFEKGNFSASKLADLFEMNNCYMTFTKIPRLYQDKTNVTDGTVLTDKDIYINGESPSNKNLVFEFKIHEGIGVNATYKPTLCIDMNGDGKYNNISEIIAITRIYDKTNNIELDPSSELTAENEYLLEVNLSSHVGVITWQLSIDQVSSSTHALTGIRDSITGISAIKCVIDTEIVKLRILQITSDGSKQTSIALPTDEEIDRAKASLSDDDLSDPEKVASAFVNQVFVDGKELDANLAKATGLFYYYTKDLNDYDLTFERMSVTQFSNTISANPHLLNSYDMVIIGFADNFQDFSNPDALALKAVEDFIKTGKAILFTHDTTYHQSNHHLSVTFREMLGMDRYGVMMRRVNKDISERISAGKDMVYQPGQTREIANILDNQSYGFTDQMLQVYRRTDETDISNYMTDEVSQINQGQITDYPYKIDEIIDVAPTHYQYFQLNLEDPTINVWYSLHNTNPLKKAYELNDGRNGYYIYNKGNITYSGAGHIITASDFGDMPTSEVKLFVNTIIAAHRAAPDCTSVIIENEDKTSSNNRDYVYAEYDSSASKEAIGTGIEGSSDQTKRIYFKLENTGILSDPKHKVNYYLVTMDEDENENRVLLLDSDADTYRAEDETWVNHLDLEASVSYYIDVPIKELENRTTIYLDFDVVLTYGSPELVISDTKRLAIVRRGLFNLD